MIRVEQDGRRFYIVGDTYPIKDKLRAAGARWDSERRSWWTGKQEVADRLVAEGTANGATSNGAMNGDRPRETVGEDDRVIGGRGMYKDKTYYLVGREERGATRYDDCVSLVQSRTGKLKLVSRDGSLVFWADQNLVTVQSTYRSLKSIGSLREYAARKRQEQETGECSCSCHRGRNAGQPGSTLYDGCDRCGCDAC